MQHLQLAIRYENVAGHLHIIAMIAREILVIKEDILASLKLPRFLCPTSRDPGFQECHGENCTFCL